MTPTGEWIQHWSSACVQGLRVRGARMCTTRTCICVYVYIYQLIMMNKTVSDSDPNPSTDLWLALGSVVLIVVTLYFLQAQVLLFF